MPLNKVVQLDEKVEKTHSFFFCVQLLVSLKSLNSFSQLHFFYNYYSAFEGS